MNNRFHIYSSPYDILERFPTSVRNNFSINLTMPVEYSKYNRFTACAFISAAGQNYLLNHWWTFTNQMSDSPISLQGYIRFMFIALGGFGINLIILWLVILFFNPQWKVIAQALGILGGTVFNYLGSKYWVFISRK